MGYKTRLPVLYSSEAMPLISPSDYCQQGSGPFVGWGVFTSTVCNVWLALRLSKTPYREDAFTGRDAMILEFKKKVTDSGGDLEFSLSCRS